MTAVAPLGGSFTAFAVSSTELGREAVLTVSTATTLEDGDGETGSIPGDRILHNFRLNNEGTVTLTTLTLADSLLSTVQDRQENKIVYCGTHIIRWDVGRSFSLCDCCAFQ